MPPETPANNNAPLDQTLSFAEHLKQKARGEKRNVDGVAYRQLSQQDNCLDRVIGSAAEVERLWSEARWILTDNPSKTAPIVLEAILFLCYQHDLWDEKSLMEARHAVKEAARLKQEEAKSKELTRRFETADVQQEVMDNTDNVDASDKEEQNI